LKLGLAQFQECPYPELSGAEASRLLAPTLSSSFAVWKSWEPHEVHGNVKKQKSLCQTV